MAQIAAEELGLPLERVEVSVGDTARGPYATNSAGSSTIPSMGPAVRAAADARSSSRDRRAAVPARGARALLQGGRIVSANGGSWPLEDVTGLLEDAQILGKGRAGRTRPGCGP